MVKALIFDLDGVLVTTDVLHFNAWKALAEELGINNFTKADNARQRGVSRMASLEVVLEKTDRVFTDEEKIALADKKNTNYVKSLDTLTKADVLPGVFEFLDFLKEKGVKIALGSASKNAPLILEKTGLSDKFDAISCGLDTTKSKPDPEVFLVAAKKLGMDPADCVVFEDSDAGIVAAKAGGMLAFAVGEAKTNPQADFISDSIDTYDYRNDTDLF